ncbi:AAA family ATPase [Deinococcus antarcticus]|uniref:AAA family ATPase n=1 Tax=Deinococcus antarcticus TaxID=1298767 RepID=A0ABV8AAL4_9DEIO
MTERAEQEVDLSVLWRGIQRRLPWILGLSALLGLGTYFWARSQPPVYAANATLIATGTSAAGNDPLTGATIKAPPLPEGALTQAMQSTAVLNPLITALKSASQISDAEKQRLISNLNKELSSQRLRTVNLTARVDPYSGGSGIYTVTGKARTANAAAQLANLASQTLLGWDRSRALDNIRRAQTGFRAQLAEIDNQLRQMSADSVERQTLIARRANVQSSLTQVGILENSATGVLSRLSDAVPPLQPESPKPLRNAVLATLLGLLLTLGIVALLTLLDKTIRNEDDLAGVGLPTMATVPRLRQRDIVFSGIVRAARSTGLYEAIGFLRVNVKAALQGKDHPVLMITSTAPGEGKSSLTATLADGLAASGERVLIIDADLRRGTQETVWKKFNETGEWHQLVGQGGVRTTPEALANPQNVQVLQVESNVDMLPAGTSMHDSLSVFNQADIASALALWRVHYDIILIDSAPLLALADGLVVGKHADAVIMVTEYGRTNLQALRNAMRRAERNGLNIAGVVINKADTRDESNYGYSYSYSARGGVKA